jgi:hypothetical protein
MPSHTRAALPFLVTSVINAKKFIFSHVHANNPIFQNPIWSHYARLSPLVHLGHMKNEETGM